MKCTLQARHQATRHHRGQRGYILLTLLLLVALLIIAAAAALPAISFEIRRDREQELIHRGVQYSRAIRTYYKKFGRYPTRLEELENTNNLRFLRKRYKDPITGQDFKLLHFGEVKLTFSAPVAGASNLNGANSLNGPGSLNSPGGFGSPSGNAPAGGNFGSANSGFGAAARPPSDTNSAADQNQTPGVSQVAQAPPGQPTEQADSSSKDQLSGKTFGGGPVVGVISTSKKDSIREFNHKKKYSEWQFIYDPATDRGGLLNTPNQPPAQGFGNQQNVQPGSPNSSPFGAQPGPGNNTGQMNPNPTNTIGPGAPTQPPSNPPDK
jgi:type II secretory pathway pseudopilin PulG